MVDDRQRVVIGLLQREAQEGENSFDVVVAAPFPKASAGKGLRPKRSQGIQFLTLLVGLTLALLGQALPGREGKGHAGILQPHPGRHRCCSMSATRDSPATSICSFSFVYRGAEVGHVRGGVLQGAGVRGMDQSAFCSALSRSMPSSRRATALRLWCSLRWPACSSCGQEHEVEDLPAWLEAQAVAGSRGRSRCCG